MTLLCTRQAMRFSLYMAKHWYSRRMKSTMRLQAGAVCLQEGTAKLLDAGKSTPGNEVTLEGAQLLHDAALLRAWQAVRFVSLAAKGHWGINGAFLAPHLLQFLPSLLKLQVTASVGL